MFASKAFLGSDEALTDVCVPNKKHQSMSKSWSRIGAGSVCARGGGGDWRNVARRGKAKAAKMHLSPGKCYNASCAA